MAHDENKHNRLAALSDLKDYKIAKDNPDVIGWRVVGSDGESLGIVKDLIVDLNALKARYLSVVANRRFFKKDKDQYLLIPIGTAALDKKGKNVFVSSIDSNTIKDYPVYPGGPIPDDYEYEVRENFSRTQRDTYAEATGDYRQELDETLRDRNRHHVDSNFYNHDAYNEDQFYTSDREVRRHDPDTRPDYSSYSADDLRSDERKPQTVEDSIATIERLEDLRHRGSITEEEFRVLKKRALDI